jgi:hypothetical protein
LQSDYPRLLPNVRSNWAEPFQIYEFPVVWPALVFTLYWNRGYITDVNWRSIVTKQNLWLKLSLKSTDMNRNCSRFKRLSTFVIYLPRMKGFRSVRLPCTCLGLLLLLSEGIGFSPTTVFRRSCNPYVSMLLSLNFW